MPTLRHGSLGSVGSVGCATTLQVARTSFTCELEGEGTLRHWRTWSCGFLMIFLGKDQSDWVDTVRWLY